MQKMEIYDEDYLNVQPPAQPPQSVESTEITQGVISHSDPWWKTIVAGYTGGMITVITGHPFDTLKIRLQTSSKTPQNLFRHLYRGISPPLLTIPPSWSINFMFYQASLKIFASDSLANVYFAGAFSGVIWATCVCPPQLIQCYAQRYHVHTFTAMKEVYRKLGIKGMFRGYTATLVRDVPATGMYFWSMEVVRRYVPGYNESKVVLPFVAGCAAGIGAWIFAMPGDCLKSIIQTEFANSNRDFKNMPSSSVVVNCKRLLNENGGNFFRLYRGFSWVVARCIVTQGCGVVGVENIARLFKRE